ncbi:MAG TPA: tetratricopeptide repeat protein [Steroidobacteraceae bacterium]|nr:tetratricopeptide repeat protein [Steroidobacteraceae bacterium]
MSSQPKRDNWERHRELFERARLMKTGERKSFLRRETDEDAHLVEQILSQLKDERGLTRSLAAGANLLTSPTGEKARMMLGRVIGSYRLASILGQGGTGTVFLADRADEQYAAQVAVKLIDASTVQGSFGARFRAERQILASLNHPNIARLIDAGETEEGHPYLIMEYVQGQTLERYCDEKQLDVRQRLDLFTQICSAVQYAHQNLIVHRDLKPGNILVTPEGVPKLLDFGIAKLLLPGDEVANAELTRVNDRLLTPEYASPEQILGQPVTTASDVYSLGVVLYQLLCGLRPYKVPYSASQLELERTICVSDPDRPSVAVDQAIINGPREYESPIADLAAVRNTTPERLKRQLTGDLDAIVLRALRKEPQHRYTSVEWFATDVRRHLSSQPVQARQGNWVYYTQRFARRHTAGVIGGTFFLLFVIGVAVVMSIQRHQIAVALDRATQDGQRAETVSNFLLNVFSAADPLHNLGQEPTARSLLDQAAQRIQSDLDQQPAVRARLLEAIGRSYRRLGAPEGAIPYLQSALDLLRGLPGTGDERIGSVLTELAIAQRWVGRLQESDENFAKALATLNRPADRNSEAYANLLLDIGRLETIRGNIADSRGHFSAALELFTRLHGRKHPTVAEVLSELAVTLSWENKMDEAEKMAREAVSIYQTLPRRHPDRIMADYRLAEMLLYQNKFNEAASIYESVVQAQEELYGLNSPLVAETLGSLALVRFGQHNSAESEKLLRRAIRIVKDSGTQMGHKIGYFETVLASVIIPQARFNEAESLLRDALDLYAHALPPDHQYIASAEYYLGEALLGQRRFADAATVLDASMQRWKRADAPESRVARSQSALGEALYRQGKVMEAEEDLVHGYTVLSKDQSEDVETVTRARDRLIRFYTERGQREKLDALLRNTNAAPPVATTAKAP